MENEKNRRDRRRARELLPPLLVAGTALLVAAGLHIFVYRANFAPSGVDGIAAMLQYLSGKVGLRANAGIFTLLLNLPLLFLAWRRLNRRYVVYTLLYTATLSLALLLYEAVGLYQYDCLAEGNRNDPMIAAIFGGLVQGLTGIPLRLGGSSGGVDIVGSLWARRAPHQNIERLIAYVSYLVVGLSLLVYRQIGSACLSLISIFVCERVSAVFLRPMRVAYRFEIMAEGAAARRVRAYILGRLSHGVTVLSGEGGYSGGGRTVMVSLVSPRHLRDFIAFLKKEDDVFYSYSEVMGVGGRFERGAALGG